jgi:hypothetical protein
MQDFLSKLILSEFAFKDLTVIASTPKIVRYSVSFLESIRHGSLLVSSGLVETCVLSVIREQTPWIC